MSYELALGETRVYWTTPGAVESVGKDGSGRLTLVADQDYVSAVAVDGAYVYWIEHGPCAVRRILAAGGPIETLWATAADMLPLACTSGAAKITLAGDHVYWGGALSLARVAKTGGPREVIVEGELARQARDVIVDATHVYWIRHAGFCEPDNCKTGALWRVCKPA